MWVEIRDDGQDVSQATMAAGSASAAAAPVPIYLGCMQHIAAQGLIYTRRLTCG
jgi:hypothetical protein